MSKPIYASMTKPDYSMENGEYPARLYQIIQIGRQLFSKNGREWYSPQIIVGFEFPTLAFENQDGVKIGPVRSLTCFLSMNPSRNGQMGLREIIDSLRGSDEYTEEELEQFDISKYLGAKCMVTLDSVESKGQVYQNIVAIRPAKKEEYAVEKDVTERTLTLVTTDDFSNIANLQIPNWIKDKIMASEEYKDLNKSEVSNTETMSQELENAREDMAAMPTEKELEDDDEVKLEDVPF